MIMEAIETYLSTNLYKPFYAVVGDAEYSTIKSKIEKLGSVKFVRLSSCCSNGDKKPDLDKLREILSMADLDCRSNRLVFLGVGEYLALEGSNVALQILEELITFNLGSAKAVFLLRGVAPQVTTMLKNDLRYADRQIVMSNKVASALSFGFSSVELSLYDNTGFKAGLELVEDGKSEKILINTSLFFPNSMYSLQRITNTFDAVCKKVPEFSCFKQLASEANCECLLKELSQQGSLDEVFAKYQFNSSLVDFYEKVNGAEYTSWLYYVYLTIYKNNLTNSYLKLVLDQSNGIEDFKFRVIDQIASISCNNSLFWNYYQERKRLLLQYPESDIAAFVIRNRFNPAESVYKLTDNTLIEKEEIISDIAQHGMPEGLENIYPALAFYLRKYRFVGSSCSELLTEYFEQYKKQKLSNVLSSDFLEKVDQLAISRDYNRLPTRNEIVASIDQTSSFLCWIDALGVEYLSFIEELAYKKGLAITISIGRSDLPTITSINREFYDFWSEEDKRKVEDLDDVKHKEKGGYKFVPNNIYAKHLAKELEIISGVIDEATTVLGLRLYDRFVIASDHGASRLAVLRKKEEKYDTDTKGEHSGRCCGIFPDYNLPFATEENGYVVLADYGRFKKSRAANVEVHGGASLEEVVVPTIVLSLRDSSVQIKMVESIVKADYKTGVTFTLYTNKEIKKPLSVEHDGRKYLASQLDLNHYEITIPTIKRACKVKVGVYVGKDLLSHIIINAVGKSATLDSDFDDLF